ncbi:MAG: cell division protein FtsA [Gammaproteobacteria bacterium]|jgi:cell division protein FtsA|nr:cell division protein FtsA [Sideroxydans sp.]MBU3903310.1 cell division protein FtsA [Gammaproteobacteria bacterium]MBU4045747.1 cell division protein FtsA [Gammaproteobacteria bacterium]
MSKESKSLIVGLDIGTSKIACIVAEVTAEGTLEVIGAGMHQSSGMKKGMVVNIDATVGAIQQALQEAELMADCKIRQVYTGIAGGHIRSSNAHGMIKIKDKEVAQTDVLRAIETASSISLPGDQQILHILEQEFSIDGQSGIKKPMGMSGLRLEVEIHIVTGAVSAVQNILKCIHRCGLEVEDMILQPLASSKAVLADDERELGVCLVDIGGGTTDVAIFTGGAIRHTAVIPIAGDQITNDIAMALRTPTKDAEDIKIKYGCALRQLANDAPIEVPGVGERSARMLSRQTLAEVIEPRVEELYSLVQTEIRRSGFEDLLSSGIVITGGSAAMQGMVELGEEIFHLPVRLGLPRNIGGLSAVVKTPRYATGVGLLVYGLERHQREEVSRVGTGSFKDVLEKMKDWFKGNF